MKRDYLKKNLKWFIGVIILCAVLLSAATVFILSGESFGRAEPQKFLSDYKLSDIAAVDIQRPEGLLQLRQSEGKMYFENAPSFDLDQQSALAIATNSAYLCVKETPDQSTLDKKAIGLNPAQYTVTVTLKNNNTAVFYLGNQTPDKTGRYAMAKGKRTIVIIPDFADRAYTSSREEMFNKSVGEINWAKFNKVEMTHADSGKLVVELNQEISTQNAAGIERMFLVSDPYKVYASPSKVKSLFDDLTKVRFDEYVGQTDDLKQYGLDKPDFTCAAYDSEGSKMEFNRGKSINKGNKLFFYCNRPRDPQNVFLLSEEKSAFSNMQAQSLVDPALFPKTKGESETSIAITQGYSTNQIVITGGSCILNGVEVTEDVKNKIVENFSGLTITHVADKSSDSLLAATILVDYGTRQSKVELYEFDEKLLVADQGFGKILYISKQSFEKLLESMK